MYIRHHDDSFVKADVHPHADPATDPRFLSSSPHFVVLFDGKVTYNAKPVTLAEEAQRCGKYLLALLEAERIAGKESDVDRSVVAFLAKALVGIKE